MSDEEPDTTPPADRAAKQQAPATEAAETPKVAAAEAPAEGGAAQTPAAEAAQAPAETEAAQAPKDAARETPAEEREQATSGQLPKQAVLRMPRITVIAAGLAMIAGTPLAWSSWWLTTIYLVPIGFIVWVLRNRTVVDADGLTARRTFTRRTIGWDQLTGLKITRGKVRAALGDDDLVALPAVRTRHLPMLAAFSGGRIGNLRPPGPPA